MPNCSVCCVVFSLICAALPVRAEESVNTTAEGQNEAEAEPVVVSATRFDIPLEQSPSSVSVITARDLEWKQIERVGDADGRAEKQAR